MAPNAQEVLHEGAAAQITGSHTFETVKDPLTCFDDDISEERAEGVSVVNSPRHSHLRERMQCRIEGESGKKRGREEGRQ